MSIRISRSAKFLLMVAGVLSLASPLYSEGLSASSESGLPCLWVGQPRGGPSPAVRYERRGRDTDDRPQFPDEEEIQLIKKRTRARSYPTLSTNLGVAFQFHNRTSLNRTFDRIEEYYGADDSRSFDNPTGTFSLGVRLHTSERFALWWEYLFGDTKPNLLREGNRSSVSSISFSALYTLNTVRRAGLRVSLGAGLALQKLKAGRVYQHKLADNGTLEAISFVTDRRIGFPMTALFEFVNAAQSGSAGFFLSARYILASKYSRPGDPLLDGYTGGPVEADMDGFLIICGLVINI
ncbi:MAG: hypothetical protein JSU65_08390 [Candidatus Zixiibacteriota bacterium]|nr:MAG: hypothetical protein JSU65_08390 [candidate division Zixibacteria bacterium]